MPLIHTGSGGLAWASGVSTSNAATRSAAQENRAKLESCLLHASSSWHERRAGPPITQPLAVVKNAGRCTGWRLRSSPAGPGRGRHAGSRRTMRGKQGRVIKRELLPDAYELTNLLQPLTRIG